MQEEVDQKTIALSMKTGKLTAQVLQAALKKYLQAPGQARPRCTTGSRALAAQKARGGPVNIDHRRQLSAFSGPAPRNTAWTLRCGKMPPLQPRTIVIFKAYDADNMEQAFGVHSQEIAAGGTGPQSAGYCLPQAKAAARNADRAKEKFKERGLSR